MRLLERDGDIPAGILDDRRQGGLGPQRLDLEGLHRVEQGRRSAHRFGRGLEREIGLLALTGVAPALGDARAVLGESEQLLGLCGVGLDLGERLGRIAGGEPFDGFAGVRHANSKALGIGPDAGDDLGSAPRTGDLVGEGRHAVVEHVFGPFAQLHDAPVAGAQLFGGVGDLVVIELVQPERVAQMLPHRGERHTQLFGRVGPELGLGEDELVGGEPHALVGGDQGRAGPLLEVGILGLDLMLITFAFAPESGHASILLARLGADCVNWRAQSAPSARRALRYFSTRRSCVS